MVKNILLPIDKMDGDSLPVSAFMDHVDGQFELGASAYEKRGVAVTVPEWDADKCIQCNSCAYVCPHATIRPFALTEEEATAAPAAAKIVPVKAGKGKGEYSVHHGRLPAGLHGLRRLRRRLPRQRPSTMVAQESQLDQQEVFNYMVAKVVPRRRTCRTADRQGQPVQAAACSSSPAPAQAAPRPAMPASSPSSSATACISPTPPAAPPSGAARLPPPPTARQQGRPRPRMVQLPVRGQRRARLRHVPRPEGHP